ncbi:Eukaryotic translation initiation factor eIF-1 [Coemansia thaxteri]|uniref:Eukaryotic translation initiation factor eIF-1 n=1 Tax=Coemansia thaxteri TaxID=2663907 RepID=A0A9W8BI92_9FUNG|nr:Eukaryotic translation initiation factor eIF-1 [Coemansia thaxteri]KAJ2007642.1 Eukaryotic translation initiation factor eIF-1 [Coemansia thaxteri]KAJ2487653.1 Eukaryotic translation initiation factor eIF-1 [Coemansia sp. RSA 2320]
MANSKDIDNQLSDFSDSDSGPAVKKDAKKPLTKASTSKAIDSNASDSSDSEAAPVAKKDAKKPSAKTSAGKDRPRGEEVGRRVLKADDFDTQAAYDPFGDTNEDAGIQGGVVHIRIQQRNGRKTLTTIQGLSDALDLKKILKYLKKELACNGTIVDDEEYGMIVQLSGDQRAFVSEFLLEQEIILKKSNIKIHGF